jgi:phosphopantothenoylcysteine synthetase/decarboxylase
MIYGVGSEIPPKNPRLRLVQVETNRDVESVLKKELEEGRYDGVIHAMALLDFEPTRIRPGKVASRGAGWQIQLRPTPKIILKIRRWAPKVCLVGFKLEVSPVSTLVRRASRLLQQSKADLIVGNFLTEGADHRHAGYLIERGVDRIQTVIGKKRLAKVIVRWLIQHLQKQ